MLKKCNRILAFLLALVLVITTFKSDFNGLRVFAGEEDAITVDAPETDEVGEKKEEEKEETELPPIFVKTDEVPVESVVPVTVLTADEVKPAETIFNDPDAVKDNTKDGQGEEGTVKDEKADADNADKKPVEGETSQAVNAENDSANMFEATIKFSYVDANGETNKEVKTVSWDADEDGEKYDYTLPSFNEIFKNVSFEDQTFDGWEDENNQSLEVLTLNNADYREVTATWKKAEESNEEGFDVEENKVDIDVFVRNSTNDVTEKEFKKLLGLEEANEGQYAIGSASISEEFVKAEASDNDTVKGIFTELNTDGLNANANNTVADNVDKLTFDYIIVNTEEAGYQLVINISDIDTKTVTFIARYFENKDSEFIERTIGEIKYLPGNDVHASDSNALIAYKKTFKGVVYAVNAIFTLNGEDAEDYVGFSNIQEDKTVYVKYLPLNLEGDIVDAYFFLLKRGETLIFTEDDPLGEDHQPDNGYFPEGSGYWAGYAKNIDSEELADKITYPKPDDYDYKAIFDWYNGINQSEIGFGFKSGTTSRIQEHLDADYNAYLDADDERFTLDDIRWYVYKSERAAAVANHIDGYVTAYVTYDSNYFDTKDEDQTRIKDAKIKVDDKTAVKDNMFTSYPYEFIGWNTERDGSGTAYSATDEIVVNKKIVLYAQWKKAKKYKIKIQVDADGKQLDVVEKYSGIYFTNDLNVNVKAEMLGHDVDQNNTNGVFFRKAVSDFVNKVLSLGTLVVYAADEDADNNKRVVDPVTELIDGLDVTVEGLYTTGGKGLDVGNYPVDLHYDELKITTKVDGSDVDVKDLFEVEVELKNGEETKTISITEAEMKETTKIANLEIVKRNVVLTSGSDSKVYDGTPLTKDGVSVSGDGWANGKERGQEGATYNVTGSQTAVGSSSNPFTYTLKSENTFAGNYNITTNFGTLTVTPPRSDDNPPPDDPPTITPPTEGQVLGATRPVDGAAVLGARRGRTEDSTNTFGRIITIIVAAAIGFTMVFIKRKTKEE
ncbi:InlB B-repeat-containing protein [Butyrivibrio sp. FCS006]|uniref:InlB B-repeat-containing protein n=1 Tax=Butyrivibrio sp. FCS006 TaxID=1280684 RepID=UPI0003F9A66C|nr:InlB B-repeat-containing protein [Butyrivibrio sp. FCS006]